MPRPWKKRRIQVNPEIRYFKPQGVPAQFLELVDLQTDELEAIRLKDFMGMDQDKAARRMEVSTSTFQRVLYAARKKVVEALLYGKAIKITDRKEVIDMPCGDGTGPMGRGHGLGVGCAGRGGRGMRNAARVGSTQASEAICPSGDTTVPKKRGIPCTDMKCPKCGSAMVRSR